MIRELATKIYEKLLEKGCVIGNASIPIIEQVLAESNQVEVGVKPVDYGTCKNCIFNLEESETSLVSECQLTVDEFTGIGVMFSRDFGCNQWQSKPSV